MMATDHLRSPHERRSDQLSILTRRAAPAPTPGRFAKTAADAPPAFDPAFDSDADTDGPASGSSCWRRDFSRILSTSSAGFTTNMDPVPKQDPVLPVPHPAQKQHPAPIPSPAIHIAPSAPSNPSAPVAEPAASRTLPSFDGDRVPTDDEQTPPAGTFARERACSFYGKEPANLCDPLLSVVSSDPDPDPDPDKLGPMSKAQLRHVLDDDYHLFYTSTRPASAYHAPPPPAAPRNSGKAKEPSLSSEDDTSGSPVKSDSTAPDSPEMRDGTNSKTFARKVRRLKLFASEERLTLSVVSGGSDEDKEKDGGAKGDDKSGVVGEGLDDMTGRELNMLLAGALERPRLSSGAVPLFVEEVGRIPRAAIVNGKVQRVRVRKRKMAEKERKKGLVERVVNGWLGKVFGEEVKSKRNSEVKRDAKRRKSRRSRRRSSVARRRRTKNLW